MFIANSKQIARRSSLFATKNLVLQYLFALNQISGFTKNLVLRPTFASSARPPHSDMDVGGRQRQLLLFQSAFQLYPESLPNLYGRLDHQLARYLTDPGETS
jgi:hypothetical protein